MGLLAVGPMGAGKTFVIKAFLKEAGLSGIALKNFRSKWVGSTEANLDRVLATVKAMGPIALVIDEGDRSFGKQGDDADGGTSSRVIARLKEFMSDPENRGQVLFILMTNRPRQARYRHQAPRPPRPQDSLLLRRDAAERAAVVSAVFRRYDVPLDLPEDSLLAACEALEGYSNADLEALALLAAEFAERAQRTRVRCAGATVESRTPRLPLPAGRVRRHPGRDAAILARAIDDFMPPQETTMVRYMEMLAVAETSRRSLLPQRFRSLSAREVQEQLAELRRQIHS
jgi:transitional endoplasmic reticulum ATPase